ncbi:MAG: NAD-glutamate dehydrogenase [Pseudorhodoplanes sp.]|nr:NAD-glutamate dehydrogenase [Pseudorhodoplanes sp.]
MSFASVLDTEEERIARKLIEDADQSLNGRAGPLAQGFVPRLFSRAAPEDLVGYEPEELAVLGAQAWDFLQVRRPGHPKIRFVSPQPPKGATRLNGISVIEIVNDDMPFLVDSVMAALAESGLSIRLVAHPVLGAQRDASGALTALSEGAPPDGALRESFIHVHVERIEDELRRTVIVQELELVLADVRVAVADWRAMLARVGGVIEELRTNPPPLPAEEIAESIQFLEWLVAENFTFLGVRDHVLSPQTDSFDACHETGLGILRDRSRGASRQLMSPEIRAVLDEPRALFVTKSASRSRVHRRVFMDYVGVKRYDAQGRAVGEFRILGLFTSTAYTRSTRSIPFVRRKIDAVLARAGFSPAGHSGKALLNTLETYPRDELFQLDQETLYRFAMTILQLEERPRVRVLVHRDRYDRFVSALVYMPGNRADSRVIGAIGEFLAARFKGSISTQTPFVPEGPLVRIHFVIRRSKEPVGDVDRAALEYGVGAIVRTWSDALSETLALAYDAVRAKALFERYSNAFSPGYRHRYMPSEAVADIRTIENLTSQRPLSVEFHARQDAGAQIGLKVWSYNRPIPLSERVPILENMGFRVVDETTFDVTFAGNGQSRVALHDMVLERADGGPADIGGLKQALEACLLVVMRGVAENDGYNGLVLAAELWWRDVALIRAISRYLRQIRVPFSQDYMWTTLRKHPAIAAALARLFQIRFDPRLAPLGDRRAGQEDAVVAEIETALISVQSLDEDRIVRHFVGAIRAAVRTNFFQTDVQGQAKAQIAIKFDSRKIDALPLPKPLYEIFVYSPRVEGVHLRFGKVARGGIRWSDRPQDFRTEILGLVKAQQVKNAVIVPVGAKGGFVPKLLPVGGTREAVQAEGVATYKLFIASLLDVTDNIADEAVVPPENVVRHDGDDPYLVVAADKGTATFSDIANALSLERDFWLGDAFASGGSAGYDHKKMGITARGAWEAVKRHFREMDIDIAATPFTVAGVGDMSGDVFGNGMLREKTIRLVAAFDHRDIFIDPAPDPEKSFAERARLFVLPRSSWQDYDKALISKGGGVFPRSLKEIPVSAEMRALLHIESPRATPQEVMRAILSAPVDLLWFGGIGTYVRASEESDEAVGDRANDAIRIAAAGLGCKVIGEGANLGMTQRGRVEAALRGVRLNTDAIDNSAGVNTSDVEVNIKIALSALLRSGTLALDARNDLLAAMTQEVARLVLRNNYQQTLALSLAERRGLDELGFQQRLMQALERRGLLDRAVELLPDDMALAERRRRAQPLTRPELAVLLAYAKLTLFGDVLETGVPDDPYLRRELSRYFPALLGERFPQELDRHRLRREIIATHIVNSLINRGGPSVLMRMMDETGAPAPAVVGAFVAVRDSYDMPALNAQIDALDAKIPGALQLELYAAVQDLLLDRIVWFLRNADLSKGLSDVVERYARAVAEVEAVLTTALPEAAARQRAARIEELTKAGVPDALAARAASLPALAAGTDIALVADKTGRAIADAAATYFAARDFFRIDRIAAAATRIAAADYFDRLALDRARDELGEAMRRLTAEMLLGGKPAKEALAAWVTQRGGEVERIRAAVHEIADTGLSLSKLTVAASLLRDLAKP